MSTQPTGRDHDHARETVELVASAIRSAFIGETQLGWTTSEDWHPEAAAALAALADAGLLSPRPDTEVHSRTCGVTRCGACEREDEQATPAPAPVETLAEHAKTCDGYHRCDFVPAPVDDREALVAELADERAARQIAGEAADRFRDVVTESLGLDENPGDDALVSALRARHGKTGPEPRRWRDFLTGALAQLDQIQTIPTPNGDR